VKKESEMGINLQDVGEQRSFEVIPQGTICECVLHIRFGNGEEGMKHFSDGACMGLDCELTVESPEDYFGRKIFKTLILKGTTEGHEKAADISRKQLRAIVDSKFGLKRNDLSAEAQAKRNVRSLEEFDGVRFMVRVGVEPPKGQYPAKNVILQVITPDMQEWHALAQTPTDHPPGFEGAPPTSTTNSGAIERPDWSK
jgi:hypothetical protein